jgi:long-chain fatty acid transport protein
MLQKLTEKISLLANVGWQNWSKFGKLDVAVNSNTQTNATPDANRTPSLPVDRQWRYATGLQFMPAKNVTIAAAYEFVDLGSAPINVKF